MPIPILGLYEAHLTVADLDRSIGFYGEVMGFPLAHRVPARRAAFLWTPRREDGMLGLWEIGSSPVFIRSHLAFRVALDDLRALLSILRGRGLTPTAFGREIDEPEVLAWMPAASVYVDDPDGHSVEFIALLPGPGRPDLGRLPLSRFVAAG